MKWLIEMAKRYVIVCPICKTRYLYSDEYRGQSVECSDCKNIFAIDGNVYEEDDGVIDQSQQSEGSQVVPAHCEIPSDRVEAKCGKCGYSALIPKDLSGKLVKCPRCANVFTAGDLGGFEIVDSILPQRSVSNQSQQRQIQPVKIQFAKDVAIAYSVTITYKEKTMVKFGGKMIPRFKERTVTGKLGETIRVPIQRPTTLYFKIGGMCGSGEIDAQPEAKYVVRRSGVLGCSWQATEVDVIGGQQGTFSGGLALWGWRSGN